jgi:hypothetical protein
MGEEPKRVFIDETGQEISPEIAEKKIAQMKREDLIMKLILVGMFLLIMIGILFRK